MLLFGIFSSPARAQTPNTTVNFQARILQSSGSLVPDGNYHLEFKIYDTVVTGGTAQGVCSGNCLWMETRSTGFLVRVVNGYVSVNLGSVTAFPSTIPWSQDLYVTMRVGGMAGTASWDTEMVNPNATPANSRMKLGAVPLALVANNVRSANRTSAASDNITIQTGNTTTSGNSGNITIDVGTAATTAGTISLGATYASALTLGRAGLTTSNAGALTVTQLLTGNLGATITGAALNVTNANANTFNLGNAGTLGVASSLTGGARSTTPLAITQANDVTNNSSASLMSVINNDIGSTAPVGYFEQAATGGVGIQSWISGSSGTGIQIGGTYSIGLDVLAPVDTTGIRVNSNITSGSGLTIGTGNSGNSAFTGNLLSLTTSARILTAGTVTDTGNLLTSARTNTASGAGVTLNVTGALANLSSNCTGASGGVCNDTSSILNLSQLSTASTGALLQASNSGTGSAGVFSTTNASGTQATGVSILRNGAGTTTTLLGITNTAGTATNGILFTGTIGTDIATASGRALTLQGSGGITMTTSNAAGTSGAITFGTGTGTTGTGTLSITSGNASAGTAGNILIDTGTSSTGSAIIQIGNSNSGGVSIGNVGGGGRTSPINIISGTGNINLQAAGTATIGIIQIGAGGAGNSTPDYLALDVKSDTGDPAGGEGYMYYNTFDNKFRCYQGAGWTDCIGAGGSGANTALSNLAGVAINTALLPGADNTIDLGSSGFSFRTLYADTSVLTPLVDAPATLSFGTGTATGVTIGGTTNATAISLQGAVAATYTIGTATGTGTITLGQATTATTQTLDIQSANGTASTQTINLGGGTSTTSGGKVINIGNGVPGASTTNTIAIGSGGTTTGTVGVTIGSIGAAAHTLLLQGGNGAAAVQVQVASGGTLSLGNGGVASTLQVGNTTGAVAQTINVGNNATLGSSTVVVFGSTIGASSILIQSGSLGTNLTSTANITVGTSNTTGTLLVLDTKTDTGDPTGIQGAMYYNSFTHKFRCYEGATGSGLWTNCIGAGSGGGGATKVIRLVPEFAGGVLSPDGSTNSGTLVSDFLSTLSSAEGEKHNYYQWSTSQTAAQDYDVIVNVPIPSDFVSIGAAATFKFWMLDPDIATTNAKITWTILDEDETSCFSTDFNGVTSATWQQISASTLGTCSFAANDTMTIKFKLATTSAAGNLRLGEFQFSYSN